MNLKKDYADIFNKNFIILCVVFMINSFSSQSVNTVLSLYAQSLGATLSVAGTLVGMTSVASLVMIPFSGPMSNRIEKRMLVVEAGIIIGVGNVVFALSESITMLMISRFIMGLGYGIANTVTMVLVTESLPADKVIVGVGLYGLMGTLIQAIGPALALWVSSAVSYPALFWLVALLCFAMVVLVRMLPESAPDITEPFTLKNLNLKEIVAPEALLPAGVGFLFAFNNAVQMAFVASYAEDSGIGGVGIYFVIQSVFMVLARIFCTKFTNRQKFRFTTTFAGVFLIAFALVMGFSHTLGMFYVASALFGIGYGTLLPVTQSTSILRVPAERKGSGSSTYNLGIQIAFAIGGSAGGIMADHFGYSVMFLSLALPGTMALVLGLLCGNFPVSPEAYAASHSGRATNREAHM